MLRPTLTTLLLAASLPVAAESLNYNIVEFSESANMEVPRDTMTAHFSVNAEGKDRQAVNQAFMKKFNQFNKISQNSKFKAELMERNGSPRYQYTNGKRTQTGWEEHAYFKVESKDFEALNRLIADSINIAVLESSSFSVSKEKTRRNRRPTEQSHHPTLQRPRPKPRPNAWLLQLQNRQTQPGPHRQPPSRRRFRTCQNVACNPCRRSSCRNRRWRTNLPRLGRNQPDRQRLGANVGFSFESLKGRLKVYFSDGLL